MYSNCEKMKAVFKPQRYLYFWQRIGKKAYIEVCVDNSKVGVKSFQYHISSDVHLAYEICVSKVAGFACFGVVDIGKTSQRMLVQDIARGVANPDKQIVIDVMSAKTRLVEVHCHVHKSLIDHRENDVSVFASSGRYRFHEAAVVDYQLQIRANSNECHNNDASYTHSCSCVLLQSTKRAAM